MQYLIVPDDLTVDSSEKAARSIQDPWNWAKLQQAVSALAPGDELEVNERQSIIALSGNTKEFKA